MTVERRLLLKLALGGGAWIVAGCPPRDVQPDAGPDELLSWPVPELVFVEGSGTSLSLGATLPAGVKAGGTFALDPGSAPLPSGMTLTPDGTLSLGAATAGSVGGVIFLYAEPA